MDEVVLIDGMVKNVPKNLIVLHTQEKLIRVFANRNPMSDKLLARRNWCSVTAFTGIPTCVLNS